MRLKKCSFYVQLKRWQICSRGKTPNGGKSPLNRKSPAQKKSESTFSWIMDIPTAYGQGKILCICGVMGKMNPGKKFLRF